MVDDRVRFTKKGISYYRELDFIVDQNVFIPLNQILDLDELKEKLIEIV